MSSPRLLSSLLASLGLCLILARTTQAQAIEQGIVYATVAGEDLKLDLCKPADKSAPGAKPVPPRPVVVCIHGGAWVAGHSIDHHRHIVRLAKEGFVAVSINYRLAPKHPYPAALDDVKAALRFVRSKAKGWNIDPERVAVLGESAGGHLALLVGLMNGAGDPDGGTKVRAVVNYCGPTDFASWRPPFHGEAILFLAVQRNSAGILKAFLGAADRDAEIVKTASPITYVTKARAKDLPPVLTLQGPPTRWCPTSKLASCTRRSTPPTSATGWNCSTKPATAGAVPCGNGPTESTSSF